MRHAGLEGVYRRRRRGCTTPRPDRRTELTIWSTVASASTDPDRLWVSDITEHPTGDGQGLPRRRARRVVATGDRLVDRRSPPLRTRRRRVADGDLASPARRRRSCIPITAPNTRPGRSAAGCAPPGLLGSMGTVGDAFDNAVAESFFGTLQLELLDRAPWPSREELAAAIFEWIECFYNPQRRHSSVGMLSPIDYETTTRGMITTPPTPSAKAGEAQSDRLRNHPRGMITTPPTPSAKPGEGQTLRCGAS